MIKPIKLAVYNACQYKKATFSFQRGITIIRGMNGCGKSNLTQILLPFAITGETPPKKNITKKELINWEAPTGVGRTEFTFEYNGRTYKITRNLHNSNVGVQSLDEGIEVDLKQAAAQAFMEEALGIDAKGFYLTCFAPQKGITKVIEMTHSERMIYFQQIFGTDRAEKIRDTLKYYVDKLPNYVDRTAEIVDTRTQIGEATAVQLQQAQDLDLYQCSIKEYEVHLSAWQNILTQLTEKAYANAVADAQTTLNAARMELQNKKNAAGSSKPLAPLDAAPDPKGSAFIGKQNELRDKRTKLQELKKQVDAAPEIPTALLMPTSKDTDGLKARIAELEPLMKLIREGMCPTCKRPHTIEDDPEAVKQEYDDLKLQLIAAQHQDNADLKAYSDRQTEITRANMYVTNATKNYSACQAEIDAVLNLFPEVEAFDAVAWHKAGKVWQEYNRDLAECMPDYNKQNYM
jgi:DNA repair exonuclease SbcCD ATPase subunit